MKNQQIKAFIRLWSEAVAVTTAANALKEQIKDEAIASFFVGRHGDESGNDLLRIESDAGTVLVSFTKAYRALDASERDKAEEIAGPAVKKHFRPSWTVSLSGLTETEATELAKRFGSRAEAEKGYVASDEWHTVRHALVADDKLAELERQMRIERINVSVAKTT